MKYEEVHGYNVFLAEVRNFVEFAIVTKKKFQVSQLVSESVRQTERQSVSRSIVDKFLFLLDGDDHFLIRNNNIARESKK